ncbi:MAG: prepilin-type N-terminal cleavage/methylation domain-containing protein [Candidatus Zixiibacteriota bacterium]
MRKLRNNKGFTIIEVMIALLITGIVSGAALNFYIKMHNQTLTQEEISEMQQNLRASLDEIIKALRKAGYKTGTHTAFRINGDSLYVFYQETQPIDTVLYFLADLSSAELAAYADLPTRLRPHKLMKQVNSAGPVVFSEHINNLTFTAHSSSNVEVAVSVQPSRPDVDFSENEGYRIYSASERVNIRNLIL